jgi:Na+/H+-dicarboxylate symporter
MIHIAMAAGLIAGLVVGLAAAATGSPILHGIAAGSAPLGTAFMNAINMVVIPLVMATIFTGVCRLGDPRKLGKLGGFSLAFFWSTVLIAIPLGMAVMKLGLAVTPPVTVPTAATQAAPDLPGMVDFLVSLIPRNPFEAASRGALLPMIVFTVLLAAAAGTLDEGPRDRLLGLAQALEAALIKLVWWILFVAPIGIFGLAAPVTAQLGWTILQSLAVFIICVIVGLVIFVAVVYLPAVRFLGGMSPTRFLKGIIGAQTVAFGTTSTVAALPVALEEADENLHITHEVANLVLPLAASMYRAGSALFQGASIVFLASIYDVPIPVAAVGGAILATFLVSLTVAPVPSSGVMTLAPALDTVGIPIDGLAILLGVDRIPDMFRTTTNLTGQVATAVVVDGLLMGKADGGGATQADLLDGSSPRSSGAVEG